MKRKYIPVIDAEEAVKSMYLDIASMAETEAEFAFIRRIVGPAKDEAINRLVAAPSIEVDPCEDLFLTYIKAEAIREIADRLEDDSAVISIEEVPEDITAMIAAQIYADEALQEQIYESVRFHVGENLPAEYFGESDARDISDLSVPIDTPRG